MGISKLKASELGKLIGKSRQYINSYKNRGQLLADENGLFDIENPINKAWVKKKREEAIAMDSPANQSPDLKIVEGQLNENDEDLKTEDAPKETLSQAKLRAELEMKNLSIQEKKMELDRKRGALVSMELVENLLKSYMTTYKRTLCNEIETLIHNLCDVHKIDLEDKLKNVTKVNQLINDINSRTLDIISKSLDNG